jgi:hypothetical protein
MDMCIIQLLVVLLKANTTHQQEVTSLPLAMLATLTFSSRDRRDTQLTVCRYSLTCFVYRLLAVVGCLPFKVAGRKSWLAILVAGISTSLHS